MKSHYYYIFCLLLSIIFLYNNNYENYENIYESNEILSDKPDDKQFYACPHERFRMDDKYPFEEYPNSNYRVKENQVSKPLKGTFSAFLDTNKIRTYDHFYHAPICETSESFDTDIDSQFRSIPGAFPEEDKSVLYELEKEKDSHDLRNPYYFYGHPEYIENKILYEDDLQKMFIEVKKGLPLHHEDDRHLVNDHNYDLK